MLDSFNIHGANEQLLCMYSCICFICSLNCSTTSQRPYHFFCGGFNVWIVFASAATDSAFVPGASAFASDYVSLHSLLSSAELSIKCSFGGCLPGVVPGHQTHSGEIQSMNRAFI